MKVILHYLNNSDYNYKHFLSQNWNIFSVILSKDQIETATQINSCTKAKIGLLMNTEINPLAQRA